MKLKNEHVFQKNEKTIDVGNMKLSEFIQLIKQLSINTISRIIAVMISLMFATATITSSVLTFIHNQETKEILKSKKEELDSKSRKIENLVVSIQDKERLIETLQIRLNENQEQAEQNIEHLEGINVGILEGNIDVSD